jgi:DNA-binding HxlR family transcriptional regulator
MARGYGQYCPLAMAAEIVAERWTPLVLRELLFGGHTFNEILRGVPLMSRSLLAKRLRELEKAGLVERRRAGPRGTPEYQLTEAGEALGPVMISLAEWGLRWVRRELRAEHLDPRPLMWDMRRNLNEQCLPSRRVVVNFAFTDAPRAGLRRTWLIIDGREADVCYKDPGFPVDLIVTGKIRALVAVWLGDISWEQALRTEDLRIEGPRELRRSFPQWLALSPVAGAQFREPSEVGLSTA